MASRRASDVFLFVYGQAAAACVAGRIITSANTSIIMALYDVVYVDAGLDAARGAGVKSSGARRCMRRASPRWMRRALRIDYLALVYSIQMYSLAFLINTIKNLILPRLVH